MTTINVQIHKQMEKSPCQMSHIYVWSMFLLQGYHLCHIVWRLSNLKSDVGPILNYSGHYQRCYVLSLSLFIHQYVTIHVCIKLGRGNLINNHIILAIIRSQFLVYLSTSQCHIILIFEIIFHEIM